jgi:hypothetical protein
VQRFQDNQAQTNFWAAFLSEGNTINGQLTKIANGSGTASAALVTQIQNYEAFGRTFDAAQGAVFQGRFDNELLHGTLQADTAAAVQGLQGILNGDQGAALAADKAMVAAAGQGFVADAMDVSGNNIPVNGGNYVGTATTISTATSIKGTAQGTIPVTATPNIANGTGGAAAAGTSQAGTGHGHDADDHHGSAAANAAGAKPAAAPAAAANTHATPTAATSHATGATHTMITMHDLMHAEAVAHQMHWA